MEAKYEATKASHADIPHTLGKAGFTLGSGREVIPDGSRKHGLCIKNWGAEIMGTPGAGPGQWTQHGQKQSADQRSRTQKCGFTDGLK